MTNPLLANTDLPAFSAIEPEHVEPAIDHILADNRARLEALLDQDGPFTWDNLVRPVEALDDTLSRAWSPVTHLHGVMDSEGLREAYNACLPKLSAYSTELGQNVRLFQAFQQIRDRDDFQTLSADQQRTVDNALRDFRLAGVDLPEAQKTRYREIASRLSELGARFQENVLDATNAWSKQLDSAERLDGLPDSNIAMLAQAAEQQGESGYRIGLDFPSVFAILTHCRDRDLRREVYEAFGTRASDQGPHAGQWDNSAIMDEILALRHEKAQLLGYDNYAELSLATKMAESTDAVTGFLTDLAQKARPVAEREFQELQTFARDELGLDDLQPWDVTFASEQLRQSRYAISQEDLRPYFPAQQVIDGLFQVVERLYGVHIRENTRAADTWHPDVQFFEILDSDGSVRGRFFTDLYARTGKRSGAWMAECKVRRDTGDGIQTAVAFLTCNFAPPVGNQPALLTHQEVETLFHEFGHGLHHMLTRVGAASVSGIHGVPWDAVELPSQFMENWCWEREALDLFAAHHETGDPIPDDLFQRMRAAKNFQSAMAMVRQLEFSLFDFRLHLEHDPVAGPRILETLEAVRDQTAVVRPPEWHRFPHGFMHIFAGGYAAGYYSYKWAEVLSADAYSRFEDEGVFSETAGRDFLVHILEKGGSEDLMTLYKAFRGREPSVDALLRHSGLAA
ncbi:oligopeptidase A [Aquisalimonas asiatica]|uniref:oligopeptidase A n=1 Tax=Aquisalimonas asiatica TaxID=406100 RepID=A0A1H8TFT2_9GAMM|nr:oligopeptidase A [Aquisalimonas asiatica]SEO89464.1 oligopeptidase A Metallo peptidase. MEROPS family M03A [Aquisalimonas asiatica]